MTAGDLRTQVRRWLWVKNLEKVANTGVLTSVVLYRYLDHIASLPVRTQYAGLPLAVTLLISGALTLVGTGLEKKLRVHAEFVAWSSGLDALRRNLNSVLFTGAVAMVAAFWIIFYGGDVKDVPVVTQVILAFVATLWGGTFSISAGRGNCRDSLAALRSR